MGHRCCSKQKVKRGLWSPEEDEKLVKHISSHGHGSWSSVPKLAGLQRCGKSCRLRWINYLRPDVKRGSFSEEEERVIIEVHRIVGNRWAQIAKHLPGRTDNEVKNFWNSSIKKKLLAQGLDPNTHNLLPHRKFNNTKNNIDNFSTMKEESALANTAIDAINMSSLPIAEFQNLKAMPDQFPIMGSSSDPSAAFGILDENSMCLEEEVQKYLQMDASLVSISDFDYGVWNYSTGAHEWECEFPL
ncbi:hypothetical protein Nepgr_032876 [Nepenthes gracilis]|uniref:Uncharacterized protein n=1 Tax=Nepenthes gracilis TaxID=150966 RepID=A0AAD3Y6F4_NEPGR|nr:hypothetical protein Nepgr_032876 [Nepenthes gracilis]